jgi:tetratricopeptide (TPR) repeat protein
MSNLPGRTKMKSAGLRCLECGELFKQPAANLFYDLGTFERKQKGEKLPFSEFYIPEQVICPNCHAENRYDLSPGQLFRVTLSILWRRLFRPRPNSWLQVAYLGTVDRRIMHPFELRAWYADQIEHKPEDAKLRLGYANTLCSQGQAGEAIEQYRAALKLAPRQVEALMNLAILLAKQGDEEDGLKFIRRLAKIRPKTEKDQEYMAVAQEVLRGEVLLRDLVINNPHYPLNEMQR